MQDAQAGIYVEGTDHHRFLEYKISMPDTRRLKDLVHREALKTDQNLWVVFGFGRSLSNLLFADTPDDLIDFPDMGRQASNQSASSTQADLFIWIHGSREDLVFDKARELNAAFGDSAKLQLDIRGFKYHENRDLIDFEDGTANPKTPDDKSAAAQNSDGGSILLTQKWVHDLDAFNALPVPDQEKIVGRTKTRNIEFEGADMPENSHISRTDVSIDGVAQKIYRRSMPFGNIKELGLYFVAFACATQRLHVQLERMYGLDEDGIYDALTDYSKATNSSYWYVPTSETLTNLQ